MMLLNYFLFIYFSSIIYKTHCEITYSTAALDDQVDHSQLPGAGHLSVPFNSFSGYLTINGNKHIHYWLQKEMPKFSKIQLEKHIHKLLENLKK